MEGDVKTQGMEPDPAPWHQISRRLRLAATDRAEDVLRELPATMRRVRTLLLVLSVSIPLFLIAVIVAIWRLAS